MFNKLITKDVACEIGFNKMISSTSIGIHFELAYRYDVDHAGFFFCVYLWKYGFEFNIYKTTHREFSNNEYDGIQI